jgi:hypothetical protein
VRRPIGGEAYSADACDHGGSAAALREPAHVRQRTPRSRAAPMVCCLLVAASLDPAASGYSRPLTPMDNERIFAMSFARVYPLYVQKVEKKDRTRAELDEVLCWLTGYSRKQLAAQIERGVDLRSFFGEAPALHPRADAIGGTVCGVRIDAITDPLLRTIRRMDKLVDELAKGRPLAKILRA